MKKLTTAQKVAAAESEIRSLDRRGLLAWAKTNGMDSASGFSAFKKALLGLGIDYQALPLNPPTAEQKAEFVAAKQAERDRLMPLPAVYDWESDKAVGLDVETVCRNGDMGRPVRVFFPKSQIRDGQVPAWLMQVKFREAEAKLHPAYTLAGFVQDALAHERAIWGKAA